MQYLTSTDGLTDLSLKNCDLSQELKKRIVEVFWGLHDSNDEISKFDEFFQFFRSECLLAARTYRDHDFPLKTFANILELVEYLKFHTNDKKEMLLSHFDAGLEREIKFYALEVAAYLWLLIKVTRRLESTSTRRTSIVWPQDESLEGLFAAQFENHSSSLTHKPRWPITFNAYTLDRIGGFKILWIDDLQDHLMFDENDKSIRIFHHATVLQAQVKGNCSIFVKDLATETIRTLALLFPIGDRDCQKWLKNRTAISSKQPDKVDDGLATVSAGNEKRFPKSYKYWGERLSVILETFNETEPANLQQLWYDRYDHDRYDQRRGVQRWTFWFAAGALLLTVVFGFLQTLIGVWQVYLIYHPPT